MNKKQVREMEGIIRMKKAKSRIGLLIISMLITLMFFSIPSPIAADVSSATIPRQVVLTWQGSTQTTMTVTWRTDERLPNAKILYTSNPDADIEDYQEAFGSSETFEGTAAWINSVELTGLTPGTEYYVIIPHETKEERFKFRTAPENPEKVVFIAVSDLHLNGTDTKGRERRRTVMRAMAEENPDFVIMVGDLWYHNNGGINDSDSVNASVDGFFDDLHQALITSDGRRIPVVPVEGNHDGMKSFVQAGQTPAKENAPFFYNRFKLPSEEGCYVLQYGPDLTLIGLNSGHSADSQGNHTAWLEQTLEQYQSSEWIIPFHHAGPYPCYRSLNETYETRVRTNWVPLYEQYGVNLVISGHDHVYKRTYPIRNNQIDYENGIVYIGDGGSVVALREPDLSRWYVFEAAKEYNFFKLTMTQESGYSMLYVEPMFPLNESLVATPFYLISKNDMGDVIRTEKELTLSGLNDEGVVFANFINLPTKGLRNTNITWQSSHPDIIAVDGTVNRPKSGGENVIVTLTATITKGEASVTKEFKVKVLASTGPEGIGMWVNKDTKEVLIKGDYEFLGSNEIALLVMDKEGNIKYVHQKSRDAFGQFQFNFKIREDNMGEEYVVQIGARGREIPYETKFYLTTAATDIMVDSVVFSDALNGQPIERLMPDRNTYIHVSMVNNTEENIDALIIAVLYDSNNRVIKMVMDKENVAGNGSGNAYLVIPPVDGSNLEECFIKLFVWDGVDSMKALAERKMYNATNLTE